MPTQALRIFPSALAAATLAALAVFAPGAQAQDNSVKLALARVQLHNTTTGISGIGVPPGADLEVKDATTVVFNYERRLTPAIGVEFALGLPPKHDVYGRGSIAFLGQVSSVKQAAPTVFLNYHFFDEGAALRPFVGAGINYTRFYGAKSNYGQNIELSDSWGIAGQVGVDYALGGPWSLCATVAAAKVKSDLVATGTTVQRTTIDFKPVVFSLGVSYRF